MGLLLAQEQTLVPFPVFAFCGQAGLLNPRDDHPPAPPPNDLLLPQR